MIANINNATLAERLKTDADRAFAIFLEKEGITRPMLDMLRDAFNAGRYHGVNSVCDILKKEPV